MANNITNRLTVQGKPEDVQRFFAAIYGGLDENGKLLLIDFNKIKPMPKELDVDESTITREALRLYENFRRESSLFLSGSEVAPELLEKYAEDRSIYLDVLKTGEQLYNNKQNYGAPTWYEWSIKNWGTKWNAYNQRRIDENTIEFLTANGGVSKIVEALSKQHPDLVLSYMYADEEWGMNGGKYKYKGGDRLEELPGPRFGNEDENESEGDEDWEGEL
ncbi:MAG: hypothetical protein LBJ21_08730 [Acidobacteriota bacterium]|jgi:hypothetical protein|nr:hypothetical protein [Acidobacteriota bacterium]